MALVLIGIPPVDRDCPGCGKGPAASVRVHARNNRWKNGRDRREGPLRGWRISTGRSRTPPTVPRRCRFPIPVASRAASIGFEFLRREPSSAIHDCKKWSGGVRERPVSIFRRPWSSSGFRRRPSACMRVISVEDSRDHGQGPLRGWWILTGRSRTPPTVPRRCRFPIPVVSGAASIDFEVAASGNPSSAIHDCKNGRGRSREPPR